MKKYAKIIAIVSAISLIIVGLTVFVLRNDESSESNVPNLNENQANIGDKSNSSVVQRDDVFRIEDNGNGTYKYIFLGGEIEFTLKTNVRDYIKDGKWQLEEMAEHYGWYLERATPTSCLYRYSNEDKGIFRLAIRTFSGVKGVGIGKDAGFIDSSNMRSTTDSDCDFITSFTNLDSHEVYSVTIPNGETLKTTIENISFAALTFESKMHLNELEGGDNAMFNITTKHFTHFSGGYTLTD